MAAAEVMRSTGTGAGSARWRNSRFSAKTSKSSCSCGVRGVALNLTNIDLQSENTRLSTYKHWPKKAPVDPVDLTKAGLYYTGKKDYVKCVYCDVMLGDWYKGDNAMREHLRLQPNCRFVQKLQMARASINGGHVSQKARIETFSGYEDRFTAKSPYDLSDAGFYYMGKDDNVKCFSCGIQVGDWLPEDDPWKEHNPECAHVKPKKGDNLANELLMEVTAFPDKWANNTVESSPPHGTTVIVDVAPGPKNGTFPSVSVHDEPVKRVVNKRPNTLPHLVAIATDDPESDDEGYDTMPRTPKPLEQDLHLLEAILAAPPSLIGLLQELLNEGFNLHQILSATQMETVRCGKGGCENEAANLEALSKTAQQLKDHPEVECNWGGAVVASETTRTIQQVLDLGVGLEKVAGVVKANFSAWGYRVPGLQVLLNAAFE